MTRWQRWLSFLLFSVTTWMAFRSIQSVEKQEPVVSTVLKGKGAPTRYDPNRPYVVIHVGPAKTATTAIQAFLKTYRKEFRRDNWETFVPGSPLVGNLFRCFGAHVGQKHETQSSGCIEPLRALVSLAAEGKHVLISEEAFSFAYRVDYESYVGRAFFQALQPHFRVQVVSYYRRHFDRLPSIWNEKFKFKPIPGYKKWPRQKGKGIPTFVEFFEATLGVRGKTTFALGTSIRPAFCWTRSKYWNRCDWTVPWRFTFAIIIARTFWKTFTVMLFPMLQRFATCFMETNRIRH